MKKRSSVLAVVLIFIMIAVAACSSVSVDDNPEEPIQDGEGEELYIVFVTPVVNEPSWLNGKEGMEDCAALYGNVYTEWTGSECFDTNEMIQAIETAIVQKADGIITMGVDSKAMVDVINKAVESGIPVVTVNSDVPNSKRMAYIGTNGNIMAEMGASEILKRTKGFDELNVAYQCAREDNEVVKEILAGYRNVFSSNPNYNEIAVTEDRASVLEGVQNWERVFTSNPNINVCINVTGNGGIACAKIARDRERMEDICIVAIDDLPETLQLIRSGEIDFSLVQNYYKKGYLATMMLIENIRTGQIPEQEINDSNTYIITQDNIDSYDNEMRDVDSWPEMKQYK